MRADIAVIGAGIVGCAVARKLAREGADVVVVDPDEPGRHASWAAAGMLAPQAEADGPDTLLPLLLQAGARYAELVPELEAETGLNVGYSTDGMLLVAFDEAEAAKLANRYDWQVSAGLEVERLDGDGARKLEPMLAPGIVYALRFPKDRRVDNRMLVKALWFSAAAAGTRFLLGRRVARLRPGGAGIALDLDDGSEVRARVVVLAAGSWSGTLVGLPRPLPVEPVHGQLLGVQTEPPLLRHAVGSSRGYLVPRYDGQVIAGTTAEWVGFRKSITVEGIRRITGVAMEIAPSLADRPVTAQWSGFRPGTPDRLPILGADPELPSLLYATGHFRNGILLGPITGDLIGELAMGRPSPIDLTPFRPTRFAES